MKNSKLMPLELRKSLSPLESNLLNNLKKEMSVRGLYAHVRRSGVALTSVAVTLDRLYKKGLVDRRIEKGRGGLRYVYKLRQNREEFERSLVATTVDKLLDKFGSTALSYFQERFGKKVKK